MHKIAQFPRHAIILILYLATCSVFALLRVVSGIGGLVEQNTPFFTVRTLITRLLELDSCKNIHDREQLILHLITEEEMRKYLPILNDILVLKVRN